MSLGKFIGKIITAPIKIIAIPVVTFVDLMETEDPHIKTITDSIEKQVKEIVD